MTELRTVYRRGRPVLEGLRYRGREGFYTWILHRATGLGVLFFLLLHIFDIFLIGFGAETFNSLLVIYTAPWARIMEVFLLFGLLFHALNGLRIIVQDFVPGLWRYERQLIWVEVVVLLPILAWGTYVFLSPLFS
ncbi:MAG TPA: succinate dehydrogenase, cytochrome b556 subunit [Longimicrobiales bacterium]|nr:succinate dehydrogenase, cytochrome b556 subunit [Longimicrobiales bacterium]